MDEEPKEIYQILKDSLKKKWKKIVSWIVFLLGILGIIAGFFVPANFIWAIPLIIVSGIILKKELKILGSFLKPGIVRISSAGPVLVVVGIIFIIVGIPFFLFTTAFLGWGIGFLIIGIPLATTNLILKHHVIGDWGHLIEGAQGKAEEIFKGTENFLKQSGVSSIKMERRELIPGIIRGALGVKREFLVVKDKHFRLRPYQVLVNARDYGNNLDIAWYLTYRLSFFRALLTVFPFVSFIPKVITDLDVFDLQDLRAYNTVCHCSVLKAVEKLLLSLNQDPSRIDRKSRGFLGIS